MTDDRDKDAIRALLESYIHLCEEYNGICATWANICGNKGFKEFIKENTYISHFPPINLNVNENKTPRPDIIYIRDAVAHGNYSINGNVIDFDLTHGRLYYEHNVSHSIEEIILIHDLAEKKIHAARIMILFIQMSSYCSGDTYSKEI
jgi:hypothetical protein